PCSTHCRGTPRHPRALPTRRSSDLVTTLSGSPRSVASRCLANCPSVNTIEPVISAKLVHALDDLTGDVVLRLDINHRTALEHQVVISFLDDFFYRFVELGLELLEHFAIRYGLGLVEFLGLELEVPRLLLEFQLETLALGLLHLVAILDQTILNTLGIALQRLQLLQLRTE